MNWTVEFFYMFWYATIARDYRDELRNRRTVHTLHISNPSTKQRPLNEYLDKCPKRDPEFLFFHFIKFI
jgi:hypothetical protein